MHGVDTLRVSLTNGGTTSSDDLAFANASFPATFSIDASGHSGDLDIAIDALDTTMTLVGHGEIDATVGATAAALTLDSADFVVNTDFAGDQFLSNDYEANGLPARGDLDRNWTAASRWLRRQHDCPSPCNMYARRFDATGAPRVDQRGRGRHQPVRCRRPT